MKKTLICWSFAVFLLSSCSLLQRDLDEGDTSAEAPPFSPAETEETVETLAASPGSMESEISRLNTKVSALETKLDVLTSNLERTQLQKQQPVIEATPQPNMAAPVDEGRMEESISPAQISAAPLRPSALPEAPKVALPSPSAGSEKDFKSAMQLFQSGRNIEAATQFNLFAQKHPNHLLASHALYWAGEASARGDNWPEALESWGKLEERYPRSAYLPEALAGLARANEKQGNAAKAKGYKDALLRAFPKSPVVLSLQSGSVGADRPQAPSAPVEDIPTYEDSGDGVNE